jgi:hypothetical protein
MRACVGRSRTSPSAWTLTSRSSPRSKTYAASSSSLTRSHSLLAHIYIASFGYCRRVHRLGHQFWVSPYQASRRRHVRSEGLATSSRCVARPSSLSSAMAYIPPTQNEITIFAFLVSHRTSRLSRFPKRAQRLPPRSHKARRKVPRARRTRFVRIVSHRWHRPSGRPS